MRYLRPVITDPDEARAYIDGFKKAWDANNPGTLDFVRGSDGRIVYLETMSDDDAIWMANQFIAIKAEAAKR